MMINWKGCGCGPAGGTIPAHAWRDRGKHGKISSNLARVFHSTVNVMKILYETVFHSILGGI